MSIAVGQVAPEFTLKDQSMAEVKLADFSGKKNVVIMFYPLDWSPVCTNEHACVVNDMKKFDTLDAQVLGLSVDSAWSHKAYAEKMGIKYPLLADFNRAARWQNSSEFIWLIVNVLAGEQLTDESWIVGRLTIEDCHAG